MQDFEQHPEYYVEGMRLAARLPDETKRQVANLMRMSGDHYRRAKVINDEILKLIDGNGFYGPDLLDAIMRHDQAIATAKTMMLSIAELVTCEGRS